MSAVNRPPARPLPRVFCLLLLVASLLATPQARARTAGHHARGLSATCKIHVINGLNIPGKFPASLRHLKRRLKAQPFKVFLSFKLLRVTSMKLATGRIVRTKLDDDDVSCVLPRLSVFGERVERTGRSCK